MKKTRFKAMLLLAVTVLLLTGCMGNPDKIATEDGFTYAYNDSKKEGIVYSYKWDGDESNMDIYIPKEINGIKITSLEGYLGKGYPLLFAVDIPEDYLMPDEMSDKYTRIFTMDSMVVDTDYKTLRFNIHISQDVGGCQLGSYYFAIGDKTGGNQDILYKVEYTFCYD